MIFKFENIVGEFYFNEHGKETKKVLNAVAPNKKLLEKIMLGFCEKRYFKQFREKNIRITKKDIKESVTDDVDVSQAINSIEEIDKILSMMTKRLREWYSYYDPETENKIFDNKVFVEVVSKKVSIENSNMGAKIKKGELDQIVKYSKKILNIFLEREELESYLDVKIKRLCPNMQAVIGTMITAKLLAHAGSLKRLSMMPSSTLQLLGAEKALFRHLKNKKSKCPKFGVIFAHQLISGKKRSVQGKAARALAAKLNIASKVDYFKGKFIGDKLRQQLK